MRSLPLFIFIFIAVGLGYALWNHKDDTGESPLLGQPLPAFSVNKIHSDIPLSSDSFGGKVTLLNVFASWCEGCIAEHPLLLELHEQNTVPIVGLVWKDDPDKVTNWLLKHGNPYQRIGVDLGSRAAIALGVAGIPETFLIDKKGIVRFHQPGPLTEEMIDQLKTQITQLQHEE